MHTISQVVARQLRNPSGILGTALTGPVMSAMNHAMIEWTVNLLPVRLDDRILDIGLRA